MTWQFADDLAIWVKYKDTNRAVNLLTSKLDKIDQWAKNLNLIFSIKKSKIVAITRRTISNDKVKVKMQGKLLECKNAQNYLGVIIDQKMNWRQHIANIENRT